MKGSDRLAMPFLGGLGLLIALPTLAAVALAFTEYSGLGAPRFVGLDNFERLIGDSGFLEALGNSGLYVLMSVPLRVAAMVGCALLLHKRARGSGAARAAVYLPTVVPDAAYALLWLWLLNPLYGPVAGIASALGLDVPSLLTDPWGARVAIVVMGVFQIGEGFVIALAARRSLPGAFFDSAAVDGASGWFVTRKVTLPMMAPVIFLLAVRDIVLALQTSSVPALFLTDGGPRRATTYLPLFAYRQAFRYFKLGYASAIAVSMFVITGLAIYVQYRVAKRYRLLGNG
jgi:multiple sugar transport system permease protein